MDDIQQRVWGLDPGFVLRVSSFISILLNAGAWILLLVVIFGYKDLIHWRRHFKDLCLAIIALVLPPIIALVFFILVIMKNEPIWDLDRIFVLKILSIISAVSWILLFAVIFGYEEMLDLYSECKKMLKKVLKKGAKELRKFFLFQEE
ncbi:MAG: hypothetical protein FIB08_17690 [Candidatus Methanoperedens sp.]|nr:hypothetical protein [Candidatus Methanoperedens sp.]